MVLTIAVFIILSGDKRVAPVVGYSEQNNLSEQALPEPLEKWLKEYGETLRAIQANDGQQGQNMEQYSPTGSVRSAILPLLKTQWEQKEPYNMSCPMIGNRQAVTGCVATAMAQLMYYYQYPAMVSQTIPSYYCPSVKDGRMDAVAANTVIEWDKMKDDVRNGSNDARRAVADLFLYCGAAVKMQYSSAVSGTRTYNLFGVKEVLKNYFGYDKHLVSRSHIQYTTSEWETMIYNELLNHRPVMYQGDSGQSGHAFIVDGYDGNGLFHFNWGWGGGDGYYSLQLVNPNQTGTGAGNVGDGYRHYHAALFGVSGKSVESRPLNVQLESIIMLSSASCINVIYRVGAYTDIDYSIGIGYYDTKGDLKIIAEQTVNYIQPETSRQFSFDITDKLADGDYKLFAVSKRKEAEDWIPSAAYFDRYIEPSVNGQKINKFIVHPVKKIEVTDLYLLPSVTGEYMQELHFTLKNQGDGFDGSIYLHVEKKGDNAENKQLISLYQLTEGNKSVRDFFRFKAVDNGIYKIKITGQRDGTEPLVEQELKVDWGNEDVEYQLRVDNILIGHESIQTVLGNAMSGVITFKNKTDNACVVPVNIYLNGTGAINGSVQLSANGNGEFPFSFNNLRPGTNNVYSMALSVNGSVRKVVGTSRLIPGVFIYDVQGKRQVLDPSKEIVVDSTVVALDASTIAHELRLNLDNANPNALYIFSRKEQVPLSLDARNVVVNGQAEQITLVDHKPFYAPVEISVGHIRYERVVSKNTWETIVLPFTPTTITEKDGRNMNWQENADAKDMELLEFKEMRGKSVAFFTATAQMNAHVPYILRIPNKMSRTLTLVFSADNVTLDVDKASAVRSSDYSFIGTLQGLRAKKVYTLDRLGKQFTLNPKETVANVFPFRAYIESRQIIEPNQLHVAYADDMTTDIKMVSLDAHQVTAVYNIQGQLFHVNTLDDGCPCLSQLPKGIYN